VFHGRTIGHSDKLFERLPFCNISGCSLRERTVRVAAVETEGRMTADLPAATYSVVTLHLTWILTVRDPEPDGRFASDCLLSPSQSASDQSCLVDTARPRPTGSGFCPVSQQWVNRVGSPDESGSPCFHSPNRWMKRPIRRRSRVILPPSEVTSQADGSTH
jgi:hypothetical protein